MLAWRAPLRFIHSNIQTDARLKCIRPSQASSAAEKGVPPSPLVVPPLPPHPAYCGFGFTLAGFLVFSSPQDVSQELNGFRL